VDPVRVFLWLTSELIARDAVGRDPGAVEDVRILVAVTVKRWLRPVRVPAVELDDQ